MTTVHFPYVQVRELALRILSGEAIEFQDEYGRPVRASGTTLRYEPSGPTVANGDAFEVALWALRFGYAADSEAPSSGVRPSLIHQVPQEAAKRASR
jgi:hypothetical protein